MIFCTKSCSASIFRQLVHFLRPSICRFPWGCRHVARKICGAFLVVETSDLLLPLSQPRRIAVSWWRWVDSARSTTRSIYSRCGTMMTTTLFRRYSSRDDGRPRLQMPSVTTVAVSLEWCHDFIGILRWEKSCWFCRKGKYLKCRLLLVCCFFLSVWSWSCGAALYKMVEMVRLDFSVLFLVWSFAGSRWKMGKSMACSIVKQSWGAPWSPKLASWNQTCIWTTENEDTTSDHRNQMLNIMHFRASTWIAEIDKLNYLQLPLTLTASYRIISFLAF